MNKKNGGRGVSKGEVEWRNGKKIEINKKMGGGGGVSKGEVEWRNGDRKYK